MRSILTQVVSSLLLISCAKTLPKYPSELKDFHLVEIRGVPMSADFSSKVTNLEDLAPVINHSRTQMNCLHFEVVNINPYEFQFTGVVPLENCHEVMGFRPSENVILFNWIDDVLRFADENNCFKKKN